MKQLTEYFRSATSIQDIRYVFNKLKTPDINAVKKQMKSVFSDNIDNIFDAMSPELLENLKVTNVRSFKNLIEKTDSELYNFIDVR